MPVHHSFYINRAGTDAVNNSVGEFIKIEFAIAALENTPAFGCGLNPAQCLLKIIQKVVAQAGLLFFVPEGRRLLFLVGFRMARDVH